MDPIEALNRIFPDAESLDKKLDEVRKFSEDSRTALAHRLSHRPVITSQIEATADAPKELSKLVADTHKIQALGEETLENVKRVTQEIKRFDNAKENLTATMRLLRQLKSLNKLYLQLDALLKERRYEEMAGSVTAASDLMEYFRPFRPLPQISQLSHEIGEMDSKIYSQIETDFGVALAADSGHGDSTPVLNQGHAALPTDTLKAACHVLDSLDTANARHTSRDRLIEWYCNEMLSEYRKIFSPGDEAGSLENVKRRYAYLKNKVLLRYMGFHSKFFPPEWSMREALLAKASGVTSADLLTEVQKLRSTNSDDIQLLLSTIHESVEFEKFAKISSTISEKLVPYLNLWVDFQDRQLHQRVVSYSKMLLPPEESDDVIPSSKELINVYRALLTQLTRLNHEEKTVEQLAKVLAYHLGQYATQVLMAYLPSSLKTPQDVFLAGKVNSTAEYIIFTTLQLERMVSSQVSDADTTEDIFESKALERYRRVSLKVEDAMMVYLQRVLEPLWIECANHYSSMHGKSIDVSRVSPYTSRLISELNESLSLIFHASPNPGLIYGVGIQSIEIVCVGFLTMAMARVSKPLSESQVEQMLLDLGAIKSQSLAKMLDLAPEDIDKKKGASRLERLPQRVMDGTSQAEAVLKVLLTPAEPMETFVRNYQLLIKDRSTLNFRKILEVKGVRYQPRAIEKFKLMASQEPHLSSENSLLKQIPTVPPPSLLFYENNYGGPGSGSLGSSSGFGINNFKKIGDFLRREHQ